MYATTDRRMSAWRFVSEYGVGLIVLYRFELPMTGEDARVSRREGHKRL
jgi:hypothetical protein